MTITERRAQIATSRQALVDQMATMDVQLALLDQLIADGAHQETLDAINANADQQTQTGQ